MTKEEYYEKHKLVTKEEKEFLKDLPDESNEANFIPKVSTRMDSEKIDVEALRKKLKEGLDKIAKLQQEIYLNIYCCESAEEIFAQEKNKPISSEAFLENIQLLNVAKQRGLSQLEELKTLASKIEAGLNDLANL